MFWCGNSPLPIPFSRISIPKHKLFCHKNTCFQIFLYSILFSNPHELPEADADGGQTDHVEDEKNGYQDEEENSNFAQEDHDYADDSYYQDHDPEQDCNVQDGDDHGDAYTS